MKEREINYSICRKAFHIVGLCWLCAQLTGLDRVIVTSFRHRVLSVIKSLSKFILRIAGLSRVIVTSFHHRVLSVINLLSMFTLRFAGLSRVIVTSFRHRVLSVIIPLSNVIVKFQKLNVTGFTSVKGKIVRKGLFADTILDLYQQRRVFMLHNMYFACLYQNDAYLCIQKEPFFCESLVL